MVRSPKISRLVTTLRHLLKYLVSGRGSAMVTQVGMLKLGLRATEHLLPSRGQCSLGLMIVMMMSRTGRAKKGIESGIMIYDQLPSSV